MSLELTRKLDTTDVQDFVIPLDTEVKMMWAVHTTNPSLDVIHSSDGSMYGIFKADGTKGLPAYTSINDGAFSLAMQVALSATVLALALF